MNNKTIIAIHGAGMQAEIWERLPLPCLPLSLPGHDKTFSALLPSIEEMAAWVMDQLATQPPASVVLVGHSMGALVALEAAQQASVAALVLMGAAARMPVHPDLLRQAAEKPDAAAGMIVKWGISALCADAAVLQEVLKKQMQALTLFNDLQACDVYQRGAEVAKTIDKPALVIAGMDDKLARSADGKILAELLPQGRLHVLQNCGHMPMLEKPAETAAEIRRFTEGL